MNPIQTLPFSYYSHPDVLYLAKDLLGKYLLTNFDGKVTGGMIIETEAYRGPEDKASHAYGNRRTKRNEVMYHQGGISYVYLIYGIHSLLNVVTNGSEIPHAILIRAIRPEVGIDTMLVRRNKMKVDKTLTSGPGTLTQALGVDRQHNGLNLTQSPLWIEDRQVLISSENILASPRVGIDYAGEDALLPWRFRITPDFLFKLPYKE